LEPRSVRFKATSSVVGVFPPDGRTCSRRPFLSSVLRERPSLQLEAPPARPSVDTPASSSTKLLENYIASTSIFVLPSYKEPTVDALASDTDEGRGWLRKATGSCRPSFDPWISEWGNPAPLGVSLRSEHIGPVEGTRGIETSQYPEERKATATP
jgi:hypothetical protein